MNQYQHHICPWTIYNNSAAWPAPLTADRHHVATRLSRLALNLVPFRVLARPLAPISTTVPHVKHLHDDTKKPGPALDRDLKSSPADDQVEVGTQNSNADSESPVEIARPTTVQNGKKPRSDAQRAASIADGKKAQEALRLLAFRFAHLKRLNEAQRATGFPNLKKAREAQRATGFPNVKKSLEV